ncbi:MAG: hypothetical protein OXF74_02470 [Rhodobacteraceae bacterium]|nr:hypothetical protein [Paracoccaceae bacterium]
MKLPFQLPRNRASATLFHIVLPTISMALLVSIFWFGFSGQQLAVDDSPGATGGAADLTYATKLEDGSRLRMHADRAEISHDHIAAFDIKGTIVQPDGYKRRINSKFAETGWDFQFASFGESHILETAENGAEVDIRIKSGSANQIGLNGRDVTAEVRIGDGSRQSLVGKKLRIEFGTESATLEGETVFFWTGHDTEDWLEARMEGLHFNARDSQITSMGAADFDFEGGHGSAGLMKINVLEAKTIISVEFFEGVTISYDSPVTEL